MLPPYFMLIRVLADGTILLPVGTTRSVFHSPKVSTGSSRTPCSLGLAIESREKGKQPRNLPKKQGRAQTALPSVVLQLPAYLWASLIVKTSGAS